MSHGTFTTFLTSFQQANEAKKRQKQKEIAEAASEKSKDDKSPAKAPKKKPSNPPTWHFDEERKRYLVPMYVADPFVVRRSAQLLGGRKVKKYTHYFESGNLFSFLWIIFLFDYVMMMLVRYEWGLAVRFCHGSRQKDLGKYCTFMLNQTINDEHANQLYMYYVCVYIHFDADQLRKRESNLRLQ
jgi:hypothetical protein